MFTYISISLKMRLLFWFIYNYIYRQKNSKSEIKNKKYYWNYDSREVKCIIEIWKDISIKKCNNQKGASVIYFYIRKEI